MRLEEHERRAKETFGHPFTEVHRFKDSLASFCGPVHRALPPHDPPADILIAIITGNPTAGLVGAQHGIDDLLYTIANLGPNALNILKRLHQNLTNLLSENRNPRGRN